ncbi:hypothetical protein CHUAL_003624 [Chamberlinius hualienensis]
MEKHSNCIIKFKAEVNSTVNLNCIIKGGDSRCSWKRNDIPIEIRGRYSYLANENAQKKGNCSIAINNVIELDLVKWKCEKAVSDQPQHNSVETCEQKIISSNNFQKIVSIAPYTAAVTTSTEATVTNPTESIITTYSTCNSTNCGPVSVPLSPIVLTFSVLIGAVSLAVLIASLVGIYCMFVSRRQVRRPDLQSLSTTIQLHPITPRRIGDDMGSCVRSSSFSDGSVAELYDDAISLKPSVYRFEKASRSRRRRRDLSTSMQHLPGNEYQHQKKGHKKLAKYKDIFIRSMRSSKGSISTPVTPTNHVKNYANRHRLRNKNDSLDLSSDVVNHKYEYIGINNITTNNWSNNTSDTVLCDDCNQLSNPPPIPKQQNLRLNVSFDSHLAIGKQQLVKVPTRQRPSSSATLTCHVYPLLKQLSPPHSSQTIDVKVAQQIPNVAETIIVHTDTVRSRPVSETPKTVSLNDSYYENIWPQAEHTTSEDKIEKSDHFNYSLYGNIETIKSNESLTCAKIVTFPALTTTRKKPLPLKRIKNIN